MSDRPPKRNAPVNTLKTMLEGEAASVGMEVDMSLVPTPTPKVRRKPGRPRKDGREPGSVPAPAPRWRSAPSMVVVEGVLDSAGADKLAELTGLTPAELAPEAKIKVGPGKRLFQPGNTAALGHKNRQKAMIAIAADPDEVIAKLIRPKVKHLLSKAFELADGIQVLRPGRKKDGSDEWVYMTPPDRGIILYLLDQYMGRAMPRKDSGDPADKEFTVRIDDVARPRTHEAKAGVAGVDTLPDSMADED